MKVIVQDSLSFSYFLQGKQEKKSALNIVNIKGQVQKINCRHRCFIVGDKTHKPQAHEAKCHSISAKLREPKRKRRKKEIQLSMSEGCFFFLAPSH